MNRTWFFTARDDATGVELWKTDGTAAGTGQLDDLVLGAASSSPSGFTRSGSLLYVTAEEALHGRELWPIPGSALGEVPTSCVGDCGDDGAITIDEILTTVHAARNGWCG